jgi:hypothetical protein
MYSPVGIGGHTPTNLEVKCERLTSFDSKPNNSKKKKCFKHLRLFNQSLLARQAWHLLIYPDSLARLLKARYFPRGHLLDTTFCCNPSSTWQAIMHGLNLLKKGVIWRVGDGKQIRIWRDPWIPWEFLHRVTTRPDVGGPAFTGLLSF